MKIVVRNSRGLLIFCLCTLTALAAFGGFLIAEAAREAGAAQLLRGLGVGLIVLTVGLAILVLWCLADGRPRFIVEEQGITMPTLGLIPWSAIRAANLKQFNGPSVHGALIYLEMTDPGQAGFKPVTLNFCGTSVDARGVLRLIQQRMVGGGHGR